ncbi:MAG TPA: hypothetical protein VGW77_30770 [Candidatus Binatia bacterium]|nr:hypothetical protein [Candidatus Binatia bacterium]
MNNRNGSWLRILVPTFIYAAYVLPYPAAHGNEPTMTLQIAQAGAPKGTPLTVRGKISAIDGANLRVATTSGEVMVRLPENVRIGGVAAAQLSDIGAGSYVGTTATKQADGNLKALEVHIFPESARGTGEGQRPWDLQPGSTMTNANVEKIEQIAVEKVQGQMLLLKYKGGEAKVFVPPGTPIVRNVAGDRSLLKPGVGVFIPAVRSDDGTITATRVTAGVGGIMPPM